MPRASSGRWAQHALRVSLDLHEAATSSKLEALAVVRLDRRLDRLDVVLGAPSRELAIQRGPDAPVAPIGDHRHERRCDSRTPRVDRDEPRTGRVAVEAGDEVGVGERRQLERVDLGHRHRVLRPDGIEEVEGDLLVRPFRRAANLDVHAPILGARHGQAMRGEAAIDRRISVAG
jgi:hypothetical protein